MATEKLLFSLSETAAALNMSRPTLYALLRTSQDFPVVQIGGRKLVSVDGLRAWIDRQILEGHNEQ
jgi:predicted DNA-binding transcriptional regulator AlpA